MAGSELSGRKTILEVIGVSKAFRENEVLKDVSFVGGEGEFISLLGPSGCGKTTTLNIVAGFLPPDRGEIRIDGQRKNEVQPHRRNLAMVFQSYALFPHMTIFDNVAFGLRMRRQSSGEIEKKVAGALELVHLAGMERRYPRQLSGGQQQRVGLARALAVQPRILLLDEPLSNLDAKLRKTMQTELRAIQQYVHTTTIYVTHDQEEAFTLSDRIMLMNRGVIEQTGTPEEIYRRPRTQFVAEFIGISNFFDAVVAEASAAGPVFRLGPFTVRGDAGGSLKGGGRVRLAVRPDRLRLGELKNGTPEEGELTGKVVSRVFGGPFVAFVVDVKGVGAVNAHLRSDIAESIAVGSTVRISVAPRDWLTVEGSWQE